MQTPSMQTPPQDRPPSLQRQTPPVDRQMTVKILPSPLRYARWSVMIWVIREKVDINDKSITLIKEIFPDKET